MDRKVYDRMTEAEFRRRKFRTNCILRNQLVEIPSGTACRITRKFNGFTLATDPCQTCGIAVIIARVPHYALDLLPEETA